MGHCFFFVFLKRAKAVFVWVPWIKLDLSQWSRVKKDEETEIDGKIMVVNARNGRVVHTIQFDRFNVMAHIKGSGWYVK